jgi:NAD(P)-dependent dehydrogenase (short-subunit alcohol dehydrogenase family)
VGEEALRLKDKVAIVVGGGTMPNAVRTGIGNGQATAIFFAREGAKVLVVDRREEAALETVRTIREEGGEATHFVADILMEADCQALVEKCVSQYGRLDMLQNNVGIAPVTGGPDGTVQEINPDDFDHVMAVNLRGMAITIKHALPIMRAQKSGSIVNISSGAALLAMPILAYTCSKLGVHGLTQHVAGLGGPDGVRCNCVVVGNVENRFVRGTPWDIAYASTFLHSDEARFITGVLLPVDGGATAQLGMFAADGPALPKGGLPRDF